MTQIVICEYGLYTIKFDWVKFDINGSTSFSLKKSGYDWKPCYSDELQTHKEMWLVSHEPHEDVHIRSWEVDLRPAVDHFITYRLAAYVCDR